jgi:hypothetical protein
MLGSYTLLPRPKDRRTIKCWVFKRKADQHGYISRYKSRLVAKGFTQTPGADFDFTIALVVRTATTRMLLHLAAVLDYKVHQLDITTFGSDALGQNQVLDIDLKNC